MQHYPLTGQILDTFNSAFSIRIIPALSASSPIPISRLSPIHCSLRSTSASHSPTPHYNLSLTLLMTPRIHLLQAYNFATNIPAFADALSMLKVWANQRGYCASSGWRICGFEGKSDLWTYILGTIIYGEDQESARN